MQSRLWKRRLLATITVTSTADSVIPNDGAVTLREAITAINAGTDLSDPNITAAESDGDERVRNERYNRLQYPDKRCKLLGRRL